MSQALVAFLLITYLAYSSQNLGTFLDYRSPDFRAACESTTPKNCTQYGPFCDTCETLVFCVPTDDESTFTKTPVQRCNVGEKCADAGCTTAPNVFCDGTACLPFPCQDVGLYLDPFYCNRFVLCVRVSPTKLTAYLNECPAGFAFDVATGLCSQKLEKTGCDPMNYPVPLCTSVAQNGPLDKKPALYYICEEYSTAYRVLYPVIHVCPGDLLYQEGTGCTSKSLMFHHKTL